MRLFVFAFTLVLTLAISARGFVLNLNSNGAARHWNLIGQSAEVSTNSVNPDTHAIRYYLAADAYSETNTAAELNAVRVALGQWLAISNTVIQFEEAGLVNPPVDVNLNDHTNIIYWAKDNTLVNGGTYDLSGALAVTFTTVLTNDDNTILESDIVFNGKTRGWITDASDTTSTNALVEAVALHEIGHLLGLAHSPVGAATMFFRGLFGGANLQAGLTVDDIAGARFLYATTQANVGAIKGTVTKSGNPVFGAQVFVQDSAENVIAGTVARANGSYEVNMLPPGTYQVRAAPLDPAVMTRLVSAPDIGSEFIGADTAFLPTSNFATIITANSTNTINLTASNRAPAFRITHILAPSASPSSASFSRSMLPASMMVGQSNYYIGVASATLPTADASLFITGDGLTLGPTTLDDNAAGTGLNYITVPISVASNATPEPRSFVVTQFGTNVAYANGFLEIQPAVPDDNFDGLDDRFQRRYFPLFTSSNAAPAADPDGDGANNYAESIASTVPTNAASSLRLRSAARTNNTATIRWDSVAGKQYQVSYRTNVESGSWSNVGSPINATGAISLFNDSTATNAQRIYRVQVLP